jgi:uncharacterized NAD-dependent epimerase/dehydratase family protein
VGRTHVRRYQVPIPPLPRVQAIYEEAAGWLKPAVTVAVALNTYGLPDDAARDALAAVERETGLRATDPVRYGAGPLLDALLAAASRR